MKYVQLGLWLLVTVLFTIAVAQEIDPIEPVETYYYDPPVVLTTMPDITFILVNGVLVYDSVRVVEDIAEWEFLVIIDDDTTYYPVEQVRLVEKKTNTIQEVIFPPNIVKYVYRKVVKGEPK